MDSAKLLLKADMEAIAKERLEHAEAVNRFAHSLKVRPYGIQQPASITMLVLVSHC